MTTNARRVLISQTLNANISFHSDLVPRFTKEGFLKTRVPEQLWKKIQIAYEEGKPHFKKGSQN